MKIELAETEIEDETLNRISVAATPLLPLQCSRLQKKFPSFLYSYWYLQTVLLSFPEDGGISSPHYCFLGRRIPGDCDIYLSAPRCKIRVKLTREVNGPIRNWIWFVCVVGHRQERRRPVAFGNPSYTFVVDVSKTVAHNPYALPVHNVSCTISLSYYTWRTVLSNLRNNFIRSACFLQSFHSRALYMIVEAPWYMSNTVIRTDLQTPIVEEEIRAYSSQYMARLSVYQNDWEVTLKWSTTRFLMQLFYLY
jgi:hypothetical protein